MVKFIAFVVFIFALGYSLYQRNQIKRSEVVYDGKKYKLKKIIRHVFIQSVGARNDKYYAIGIVNEDGRKIQFEIDKELMEVIPAAYVQKPEGETESEPDSLADVLVYEEESLDKLGKSVFSITPEEIRYKWDLENYEGTYYRASDIAEIQDKAKKVQDKKYAVLFLAFVLFFPLPLFSICLSMISVVISYKFILPKGYTKPENYGIIRKTEIKTETKGNNNKKEELSYPPGYDNWSEAMQYLWMLNIKVKHSAARVKKKKAERKESPEKIQVENKPKPETKPVESETKLDSSTKEAEPVAVDSQSAVEEVDSDASEIEREIADMVEDSKESSQDSQQEEEPEPESELDAQEEDDDHEGEDPFADDEFSEDEFDPGDDDDDVESVIFSVPIENETPSNFDSDSEEEEGSSEHNSAESPTPDKEDNIQADESQEPETAIDTHDESDDIELVEEPPEVYVNAKGETFIEAEFRTVDETKTKPKPPKKKSALDLFNDFMR